MRNGSLSDTGAYQTTSKTIITVAGIRCVPSTRGDLRDIRTGDMQAIIDYYDSDHIKEGREEEACTR